MAGSLWSALYVDGTAAPAVAWEHLLLGEWVHVHLEAHTQFADDVSLMQRTPTGASAGSTAGHLRGKLAAVCMWGRLLPAAGAW